MDRPSPAPVRDALSVTDEVRYLELQEELGRHDLTNDITPALAAAYARHWLRLVTKPRAWRAAHGLVADGGHPPSIRLAGDPIEITGADLRLDVATAFVEGTLADEARSQAIVIVAAGGVPVAEAVGGHSESFSEAEVIELDLYQLLEPPAGVAAPVPPRDLESALVWLDERPTRAVGGFDKELREELAEYLAQVDDPGPLSASEATYVLARLLTEAGRGEDGLRLLSAVRWPLDLTQLPANYARRLLGQCPHAPISGPKRRRLEDSDTRSWSREVIEQARGRGDLGAVNTLTRWRVREAWDSLREIVSTPGRTYLADAATVALASIGDRGAVQGLSDLLRNGPAERAWQVLNQPMPYACCPDILAELLATCEDGRFEAIQVLALLERWFGRRVAVADDAGPLDRANAIELWRRWWRENGSAWRWDPWSATMWPAAVTSSE